MRKVYFEDNLGYPKTGKKELRGFEVYQEFQWEDLSGFVPAIYVGDKGMVMDLCIQIPVEKIKSFLEKWNQERRLAALTEEELEQMERENPCCLNFSVDVNMDGERLIFDHSFNMGWHPLEFERENIEEEAEEWMEVYRCDRESAWLFEHRAYRFEEKKKRIPHRVECCFRADPVPFCAEHFVTEEDCGEHEMEIRDSSTGERYQLTIHGCKAEKIEDTQFSPQAGREWPRWYQVLSYSIAPDCTQGEMRIQDCAKSDPPRKLEPAAKRAHDISVIGGADGPTAIFFAGKHKEEPKKHAAYSALHFEKVSKVEWRVIFYKKEREDFHMAIRIEIEE